MSLTRVSYSLINGAVFNVLDYGAVGDGTTNSTTAIQAAITAAAVGGGAVYLPAGDYKLTATLQIPYGVSIFGDGATASVLKCLSCNALTFTSGAYDNGKMFYEDFGMEGMVGSTANWAAVESLLPAGGTHGVESRDGLVFNRLKIRNFNQGFVISDLWNSQITSCQVSKVNNCISAGTYTMILSIIDNEFIFEGGDDFSGTALPYCIAYNGTVVEHINISNNLLFSYERAIHIANANAVFVNILENDIYATVIGINYVTVSNVLNITGNYIEVGGNNAIGVYANGLGSEISAQNNIENNMFICSSGTTTTGLKINDTANTNAYYNRIVGNYFSGFTSQDILLNNPGITTVENNRCSSTGVSSSISITTVIKAPVYVRWNYFYSSIGLGTPSDITDGTLILTDNRENNAFQSRNRAAAPVDGTWRVGDIVTNNAPAAAGYIGFVCTVAGTPGTWRSFGLIA